MGLLYNEFKGDLDHLRKLLALTDSIKAFTSNSLLPNLAISADEFLTKSVELQNISREANIGLTFVPGTLLLYLAGRFEYYVRILFEELAAGIATNCNKFQNLPKDFRDNLFIYTAQVMSAPRKYGHAENGRNTFINNLSENIRGMDLNAVNVKCISITTENMRPGILNDLFARIGAKDIWVKIGQQSKMQLFFETPQPDKATADAKSKLDSFMDLRNTVAHPSDSFSWPDVNTVKNYIDFIDRLSLALEDISDVYLMSLSNRPSV